MSSDMTFISVPRNIHTSWHQVSEVIWKLIFCFSTCSQGSVKICWGGGGYFGQILEAFEFICCWRGRELKRIVGINEMNNSEGIAYSPCWKCVYGASVTVQRKYNGRKVNWKGGMKEGRRETKGNKEWKKLWWTQGRKLIKETMDGRKDEK